ncbi:hypothetical protein BJ166DRAFT_324283 [Pestalotiopsis sp. NC0098]|nr:hypothetical protein BJ166DRAFT_324283 [Pestalotiopsis sp. NC0098]
MDAKKTLTTIFCGSAFGMALTAAGMHRPEVILSQLTLRNFHMLESFLSAAAGSTAVVTLLQHLKLINLTPRPYSSIGLFGNMDGNIVGGLIQGVGMALAGSCSGTVFAQVGAGIESGLYTLSGLVIGGILWTGILQPFLSSRTAGSKKEPTCPASIDKQFGTSELGTVAAIEFVFISIVVVAVAAHADTSRGLVHPVTGGLLIAASQLLSATVRKALLGTSTAFEEVGKCFWSVAKGEKGSTGPLSYMNVLFVSGMTLGARIISTWHPVAPEMSSAEFNPLKVVGGGVLLAIGSRMAGGCTSGHGISGTSLLSVSSFVTVGAMFGGAIGTALALYGAPWSN